MSDLSKVQREKPLKEAIISNAKALFGGAFEYHIFTIYERRGRTWDVEYCEACSVRNDRLINAGMGCGKVLHKIGGTDLVFALRTMLKELQKQTNNAMSKSSPSFEWALGLLTLTGCAIIAPLNMGEWFSSLKSSTEPTPRYEDLQDGPLQTDTPLNRADSHPIVSGKAHDIIFSYITAETKYLAVLMCISKRLHQSPSQRGGGQPDRCRTSHDRPIDEGQCCCLHFKTGAVNIGGIFWDTQGGLQEDEELVLVQGKRENPSDRGQKR
ncbi:hypothetical protein K469DRAFT_764789 [Zopfia rhizophila CBS 207.26]|uniref:Uncharacterized protein n=1 Tax=Zopfia rhizophila CBS 207.26 TaxID=1314779 RepID=A0A6A6D902_9PEZI|nr:hypothetical protein K469DRAFT_764789 [Zopfia rhizophila CBS 207.26]